MSSSCSNKINTLGFVLSVLRLISKEEVARKSAESEDSHTQFLNLCSIQYEFSWVILMYIIMSLNSTADLGTWV